MSFYSKDYNPFDFPSQTARAMNNLMVNPVSHSTQQKPYIYIIVKNHTKSDDILYTLVSYAGEPGKNWVQGLLFSGSGYWQYLNWQFIDIASSATHPIAVGDQVYVEVTASSCQPGGHPGYAYMDQFSFKLPSPMMTVTSSPHPVQPTATLTYTINYQSLYAVNNPIITIPIPANTV